MALLDNLLNPVLSALKKAFSPFGKLFDILSRFWSNLTHLGSNIQNLFSLIAAEVTAWRNFRENIAFRTRVINLSSAINHIQEFWDNIQSAYRSILDLVKQLKTKFEAGTGGDPAADAKAAVEDIESSGFSEILSKFPKLLKGAEKALGFVAIVADALESIIGAVDDLTNIVNALKQIRQNIETGESLFLKQSNKRQVLTLEDGTKIKIRVGSLHQ